MEAYAWRLGQLNRGTDTCTNAQASTRTGTVHSLFFPNQLALTYDLIERKESKEKGRTIGYS